MDLLAQLACGIEAVVEISMISPAIHVTHHTNITRSSRALITLKKCIYIIKEGYRK